LSPPPATASCGDGLAGYFETILVPGKKTIESGIEETTPTGTIYGERLFLDDAGPDRKKSGLRR
jgi:hypothetical protein